MVRTLESLELFFDNRLAIMTLRQEDFDATGATPEETDNLVNEALRIGCVEEAVLLTENGDCIRASLRSREDVDVSAIARDFGGGGHPGESHRDTAVREFVEETETLFFEPDPDNARRTPDRVALQSAMMRERLDRTLAAHPDWFCAREPDRAGRPRDWRTFFVEVEHRDLDPMNRAWELNPGGRFVKRRELFWVPGAELLRIYRETPERLWKRLRQMPGAPAVVEAIMAARGGSPQS